MKQILVAILMCCALGAAAETPKEGAVTMLKLLKERNYNDLFQQRYAEWYKVEAEGKETAEAIKKLSSMWERNYDMMVKLFEQLASAEYDISTTDNPLQSETGDVATATVSIGGKSVTYRLYKMKNGLWGFHL